MARRFMNVSIGILALSIAYFLGCSSSSTTAPAEAQMGSEFAGISADGGLYAAIRANGDVYLRVGNVGCSSDSVIWSSNGSCPNKWLYAGNVLTSAQ